MGFRHSKPWVRSLHRTDKIGSLSEACNLINIARQQARNTAPNMPQHQVCLDTIEVGIVQGDIVEFYRLQDVAGYGVAMASGKVLANAFSDHSFTLLLVKTMGKDTSKLKPDPSVLPIIEESRWLTNIMPGGKPISVTDQDIVEMILFPVVNEACHVLDEGVVVRASDLDTASVLGMSFPSFRGGIVFWADAVGPNQICAGLKKWSKLYGNFFEPSRFLEERATRGIPLRVPSSPSPTSKSRL